MDNTTSDEGCNKRGKTGADSKIFNIGEAISRVRELGAAQMASQARRLHHYRPEWLDQLEERYRNNPGKPLIHLSDLPHDTAIQVSESGLAVLAELWESIKRRYGASAIRPLGLENIYTCAVARYYTFITLESLHRAKRHVGFDIDQLEPYVTHMKCHKNNWPKEIEPNLPFDFLNKDGAAILGYYTDSRHANCVFTNRDEELHEFVKRAVERVVGHMHVNTSHYEDITETNWSLLLPTLVSIAGVDTSLRQKVANNPAPPWLFTARQEVVSAFLRAVWTAEGQPESMRVVQSVVVPNLEPFSGMIARHPDFTTFNEFPTQAHPVIVARPPLLLASVALLHRSLGIDVGLRPIYAYLDKRHEPTFMWTIEITSKGEIEKFAKLVNFDSTDKQLRLKSRL